MKLEVRQYTHQKYPLVEVICCGKPWLRACLDCGRRVPQDLIKKKLFLNRMMKL